MFGGSAGFAWLWMAERSHCQESAVVDSKLLSLLRSGADGVDRKQMHCCARRVLVL